MDHDSTVEVLTNMKRSNLIDSIFELSHALGEDPPVVYDKNEKQLLSMKVHLQRRISGKEEPVVDEKLPKRPVSIGIVGMGASGIAMNQIISSAMRPIVPLTPNNGLPMLKQERIVTVNLTDTKVDVSMEQIEENIKQTFYKDAFNTGRK